MQTPREGLWKNPLRLVRVRLTGGSTQAKRSAVAKGRFAKGLNSMTHRVGQGEMKTIMRQLLELQRAAHLESESTADQDERNIVERV